MKGSKYKLAKSVNIKYEMYCRVWAFAVSACVVESAISFELLSI